MKLHTCILSLTTLFGCAFGLHLELSKQFIGDVLDRESKALSVMFEEEWAKENLAYIVSIDYRSISTIASQDINQVAASFVGQAIKEGEEPIPFTVGVAIRLIPNRDLGIFKNTLDYQIDVQLSDNEPIKNSLIRSITGFANKMFDWTHLSMGQTSGSFYATHFALRTLAQVAGRLYSDDNAVYLDFSPKDLHLSPIDSDTREQYEKFAKVSPRYVGLSASEPFSNTLLIEFLRNTYQTDVRKQLGALGLFQDVLSMITLERLDELMPEVMEEYGKERLINFFVTLNNEDEETKQLMDSSNKVTFQKDTIEFLGASSASMNINKSDSWEMIRSGYMIIKAKIQAKMKDKTKLLLKVDGGIKSLRLMSKEGEQMDLEEGAIKGLLKIVIKKNLKSVAIDLSGPLSYLPCFGLDRSLAFNTLPGFMSFALDKGDSADLSECPDSEGLKESIQSWSLRLQEKAHLKSSFNQIQNKLLVDEL